MSKLRPKVKHVVGDNEAALKPRREFQQSAMWDVPRKDLPRCKYGHHHWNHEMVRECEERTLKALCVAAGVDYEALRGKPLYTGALPTPAEQLEMALGRPDDPDADIPF